MPKRTESYDKMISEKLQDRNYARDYLVYLVEEEDQTVEEAIIILAQKMGEKEFAEFIGTSKQKVNDFIKGRRKPTLAMLNKFLEPFELELNIGLREAS